MKDRFPSASRTWELWFWLILCKFPTVSIIIVFIFYYLFPLHFWFFSFLVSIFWIKIHHKIHRWFHLFGCWSFLYLFWLILSLFRCLFYFRKKCFFIFSFISSFDLFSPNPRCIEGRRILWWNEGVQSPLSGVQRGEEFFEIWWERRGVTS